MASELKEQPEHKPINNMWSQLSDDEDSSSSSSSSSDNEEIQQTPLPKPTLHQERHAIANQPREPAQSREPQIKSFDPRFLKGAHKNMKKIKGGFKSEKLQKKKFQLNAINNPFAAAESSSQEEQQNNQTPQVQQSQEAEQPKQKANIGKNKKNKKKQNDQDLEQLWKELGVSGNKTGQGEEPKKKKKKNKNGNKEQDNNQQLKEPVVENKESPVQEFKVDKQKLEEVLKKKAQDKNINKKKPKVAGVEAAKKAIQQREAKNKGKKQFLDL